MSNLTREDLKVLSAKFPDDRLGVKVQSLSKNRDQAMLVLYLQHTDVMDRLEEVDPAWSTFVIAEETVGDTVYVRMQMTVKGVMRENVGEGGDPKAAYSDALKRCAMLFGVGRYLYDSAQVWVPYNESKDRFKQWTVTEYRMALDRREGSNVSDLPSRQTAGADPAEFVIPFGKNGGMQLKDVDPQQLENDLAYWEKRLKESGETPKGRLQDYLNAVRAYLNRVAGDLGKQEDIPL